MIGPLFHGWDSFIALYSNSINRDVNLRRAARDGEREDRVFLRVHYDTHAHVFMWSRQISVGQNNSFTFMPLISFRCNTVSLETRGKQTRPTSWQTKALAETLCCVSCSHGVCVCVCVCNEANTINTIKPQDGQRLLPQRDAAQQLHRWYSAIQHSAYFTMNMIWRRKSGVLILDSILRHHISYLEDKQHNRDLLLVKI